MHSMYKHSRSSCCETLLSEGNIVPRKRQVCAVDLWCICSSGELSQWRDAFQVAVIWWPSLWGTRVTLRDPPLGLGVCSVTASRPMRPGLREPLHLRGAKKENFSYCGGAFKLRSLRCQGHVMLSQLDMVFHISNYQKQWPFPHSQLLCVCCFFASLNIIFQWSVGQRVFSGHSPNEFCARQLYTHGKLIELIFHHKKSNRQQQLCGMQIRKIFQPLHVGNARERSSSRSRARHSPHWSGTSRVRSLSNCINKEKNL